MAENVSVSTGASKLEQYETIRPQIKALVTDEPDLVANLANVAAVLKEVFGYFWVGFYLMKEGELVLGPFQGPLACTRIAIGRGVCGAAAEQQKSFLVPDVNQFPGHIACSSASLSEVVIPILKNGEVLGVLDVDSDHLDDFDATDVEQLELMVADLVAICWA
ncbi:UNVERIFIED_CONTAM: hypothetical protein GTU68_065686 [Idotea baltica]|nr:hypothetical protein [Idotea baltica]